MASSPSDYPPSRRSNEQWIADLSGKNGPSIQGDAFLDLGKYLHTVIFQYLEKRSLSNYVLASFSSTEVGELAEDFVQDTIEKLAQKDFILLRQYTGRGSFTAWAAQIARRIAATELRRPYWERRNRSESSQSLLMLDWSAISPRQDTPDNGNPQTEIELKELRNAIRECREMLSERYRLIFDRCIVNDEPIEDVAEPLRLSANAIYMLVFRVKRRMRKCLNEKGFGPNADTD